MSLIGASDGTSGGASLGAPRLPLCLHLELSSLQEITQGPEARAEARGRRKEQRSLHPLGPSCRHRRRHDFPPDGPVSVGRTASCPLPSRHPLVELLCADGGDFVNVRDPIPYISLPERLLGRRCGVDCALVRESNECVFGLHYLGGFASSGYFDFIGAASSAWAFTYQRISHSLYLLKRREAVEVGEGALSKLFGDKVYDHLGFTSVSSAATGALAQFRKSHVSWPTSAVNALSLPDICGDVALPNLNGFAQSTLLSKEDHQARVTREGLSSSYCDPHLGHNGRVCSDFVCSFVKIGSFTFPLESKCQSGLFLRLRENFSLCLILDARRSNQHFKVPMLSRVSNFLLGIRMRVQRIRSASLLVMSRMHFITWAFHVSV